MNPSDSSPRESLLDSLLKNVFSHPKHVFLLALIILGLAFSLPATLLGLVSFFILRITRVVETLNERKKQGVFLMAMISGSLLLAGVAGIMDGVTPREIHALNTLLFAELIQNNSALLHSAFVWLSALPYGVLLGCLLAAVSYWPIGLQGELRRVGRGQGRRFTRATFSVKQAQRRLDELKSAAYASGTLLGINVKTGDAVGLDDAQARLHTLVVGTTGCGKTTALCNMVESAIERRLPLFYIDGKGDLELVAKIKAFAKKQSVPFFLFSMVGESLKYNPIAIGGITSKKDRIVELRHWSEEHYKKLAEGYLQTLFKILKQADIPSDLHALAKFLEPHTLYRLARERKDADLMKKIESLEMKRKDIESLVAEIENMAHSEIGHLFDCSAGEVLTLDRVLKERGVAYFCLQPLAFPSYSETLGKLIINDLKALAATQLSQPEKIPIYAMFDEFSVFAGQQVINLINQGRGAGIHAILSTQSTFSDIAQKGGKELVGQVVTNCNNFMIQRQNYPLDAEELANIIGTQTAFAVTSQISQEGGAGVGTVRETREFIIHPDEIKRLGLGECIYVNKQPFRVQRVQLRKGMI